LTGLIICATTSDKYISIKFLDLARALEDLVQLWSSPLRSFKY
jgi:hypothetical protein